MTVTVVAVLARPPLAGSKRRPRRRRPMRKRTGARWARAFFGLATAVLVGVAAAGPARAQPPGPTPIAQSAKPADPVETPAPTKVFPEGGFPDAPEGGIPPAPPKPVPPGPPAPALPPADYAPPGRYPRDYQDAPGAEELYRPVPPPAAGLLLPAGLL